MYINTGGKMGEKDGMYTKKSKRQWFLTNIHKRLGLSWYSTWNLYLVSLLV